MARKPAQEFETTPRPPIPLAAPAGKTKQVATFGHDARNLVQSRRCRLPLRQLFG
jgi:hypothetical protein